MNRNEFIKTVTLSAVALSLPLELQSKEVKPVLDKAEWYIADIINKGAVCRLFSRSAHVYIEPKRELGRDPWFGHGNWIMIDHITPPDGWTKEEVQKIRNWVPQNMLTFYFMLRYHIPTEVIVKLLPFLSNREYLERHIEIQNNFLGI